MALQERLKKLHEYEHVAHVTTLTLVVTGVVAGWLSVEFPKISTIAPWFAEILHWLHIISIGLVFLYAVVRFVFYRRPSREVAKLLPKSKNAGLVKQDSAGLKTYRYQGRPVPQEDREFISEQNGSLVQALNQMNYTGYLDSAFEMTQEQVRSRNTAIISKNPWTFMLFRDPNREATKAINKSTADDFVGYTAVFPLNEIGKDVYLRGLIPDKKLPASLICKPDEKAAMILFFAMHLRKPYRVRAAGQKYSLLLARCIEEHIKLIANRHTQAGTQIEIWVQSESEEMRDHYRNRGFKKSEAELLSHEGFPFYSRLLLVE